MEKGRNGPDEHDEPCQAAERSITALGIGADVSAAPCTTELSSRPRQSLSVNVTRQVGVQQAVVRDEEEWPFDT
jgi:hypothetical protein